MREEDS